MDALSFRDFGFAYPSSDPVLQHVNFAVEEGAFVLLCGPTGCGKTTLLRCATPQLAPHGQRMGEVLVFGDAIGATANMGLPLKGGAVARRATEGVTQAADARDPFAPDDPLSQAKSAPDSSPLQGEPCACCAAVGYVFQNPDNQMVCDSVWHELAFSLENAGMPQDAMRLRVAEVAQFFGIEPWFHRRVEDLSGGQKQTLALAGALATTPRLLLLDEPTAMLDPLAERNFAHLLFRVNRELGVTVVAATHTPEALRDYATGEWHMAPAEDGASAGAAAFEEGSLATASGEDRPSPVRDDGSASGEGCPSPVRDDGISQTRHPEQRSAEGRGASPKDPAQNASQSDAQTFPHAGISAVTVRDCHVRYSREAPWVLSGLRLDVARGSIHALLGGNGCGKTTLLHAIAGTLKCERGRIMNTLQERQALLPQNPKMLFVCDSVGEELAEWQINCGYSDEAVADVVQRYGLTSLLQQHPYDLSGGQQQLLALAKLELTDPDLLLADEPTKGLDAVAKLAVAQALCAMCSRGVTVVLATHDLSFAASVADCVTLLFDGQDACTKPAHAFFKDSLFYRPPDDEFGRLAEGLR